MEHLLIDTYSEGYDPIVSPENSNKDV